MQWPAFNICQSGTQLIQYLVCAGLLMVAIAITITDFCIGYSPSSPVEIGFSHKSEKHDYSKGTVEFLMALHTIPGIVAELYLYYFAIFPSSLHL